ncbi:ribonuclease H-like domain-containing protein [Tanacetum coccineum]
MITNVLLSKLIGQLGLNNKVSSTNTSEPSKSSTVTNSIPVASCTSPSPPPVSYHATVGPTFVPPSLYYYVPPSPQSYPAQQFAPAQPFGYYMPPPPGPTCTPGQETTLPHTFATETLHNPTTGAWNMDKGASSYLNNSVTSLSTVFNSCMFPSVSVGDGHYRPITNTGHSILPTPFKSLHLNNVIITHHIVKNLIYVHQFVCDNSCTIEFDAFGFSVKDFLTRRVLLRCDSTGDLYPVTAPSLIPHAFLSPTAAQPTPASPSSSQLHSPVQQPSPVAQHTPVQLQFSPTTVSHQTTTVPDQHAYAIVQNPPVNPNPNSVHPMVTRFRVETNRPTKRLNLHVSSALPLPKSYHDAFSDPNWQNAMRDKYHALIKNKTWALVPRPSDTNIVRCMWLFRHKYLADGTLSCYKAHLVVNGSTQLEGVDVDETFSPVVKSGTIWIVLSLAASRHWPIHQLDVKNAFLHGDLSETVYMHQPPGFWYSVHPNYVCLLQRHGTNTAYLLLYVDDIFLTASSEILLQQIIRSLHQEFAMTDLGSLHYILGKSVTRDSSGLFLSQKKYVVEILDRAHMVNCNLSRTPIDTESKLGSDGYPVTDPTLYRSLAGSLHAEAEYSSVANAVAETCWLRNLLRELHTPLSSAMLVYCDNVRVLYVPSRYQFADIFTKGLPSALFEEFRSSLSARSSSAQTAGEC